MSSVVERNRPAAAVAALCTAAVGVLLAGPAHSAGWNFTPTPEEYQSWPQYCRVQYSFINRGENAYGNYYSDADIEPWKRSIGETSFTYLHHYCKAALILRRLEVARQPQERRFLTGVAVNDGEFSYIRTEKTSIVFPPVAVVMAQARLANGEVDVALDILRDAIAAQPERAEAYAALAQYYRKQKDLAQAVAVMDEGVKATNGESVEMRYLRGLLRLEKGDLDGAVDDARAAYAAGYPLPGLRNRLAKAGRRLADANAAPTAPAAPATGAAPAPAAAQAPPTAPAPAAAPPGPGPARAQ
jgi:tetratricopeptide (TPR) repeat protein